jgi:alpha-L-fucosidase
MVEIRKATGDASWFVHDRFGMFIHWGLYALPARHEWVKSYERMTDEEYQRYFDHFDPDLYDPHVWARAARDAGMKYFVITTKHHEGFCLWDSRYTDYKATNTPYGKELLRPMVEAFRSEGLRVGFYYSLLDWHHPDFPTDCRHPMRDNEAHRQQDVHRDIRKYAEYLHGQVRELLTDFGQVDYLFLDFSYPGEDGKGRNDWQSEDLVKMIRELQPNILVNDRADLLDTDWGWDFRTPEQFMPREWVKVDGQPVLWETCQTFSGSWGYHRDEASWKSVKQLVQMLIDTVSKGGNLLLNVGPTARGEFDERAMDRLSGIGKWMKHHSRSIYGCTQAPEAFTPPQDCRLTYNPDTNRLYVHVFAWPSKELHLDGFAGRVKYAQLLNDGSEIPFVERPLWQASVEGTAQDTLVLQLPVQEPNPSTGSGHRVAVPVIELFL